MTERRADEPAGSDVRSGEGSSTSDGAPAHGGAPGFEALFRDKFGVMVSLARLLGSDDPENTVQEAFLRLHSRWSTLRDPGAAGGYLRSTVVNLARNRTRHLAVARRHAEREPTLRAEQAPSAEAETFSRAHMHSILAALEQLSPQQRAAIVLRYWLDLPFADIADALDCPSATARSHVRRALQHLQPVIAEEGDTV